MLRASSKLMVSSTSLKGTRSLVEKVKQWSARMLTTMFDSRLMGKEMPSRYSFLRLRNLELSLERYSLSF